MKLKILAAVCAMVATSAFAIPAVTGPTVSAIDDGIWSFSGNKVTIGTNTDHFEFTTVEPGNYWANFAGSTTGHVTFATVKLNNSILTVQPGSEDESKPKHFGFTLSPLTLGETFTLDITYVAKNAKDLATGRPVGSYDGTVTITPSVPEPETYAMLAAGWGAMCFIARRRRPT